MTGDVVGIETTRRNGRGRDLHTKRERVTIGLGGAVEQLSCSRQREARCCESKAAAKPGPPH